MLRAAVLDALENRVLLSTAVTTYHNDLASSGQNLTETTLTPLNVSTSVFGKKFTTSVDGQVYAQPLYVPGQNITTGTHQGVHNVVYVATENDSLYAIDASNGTVLWQQSFILPEAALQTGGNTVTATTVPSGDVNSTNISPKIGITGTPVIDPATGFLFLVAKTKQVVNNVTTSPHYVQVLYKVSLADGSFTGTVIGDTTNTSGTYAYNVGPYVFDAHAQGAGHVTATINGQSKVVVYFNALRQNERGALLLNNGNVYIPFASHGDNTPYHGWILGFNESTLAPSAVLNLNPDGSDDGVWEGGGRIAMDPQGNMYIETGNGTFDTTLAAKTGFNIGFPQYGDYGDSFVKIGLDPTTDQNNQNINGWGLQVVDYFTPQNQATLSSADQDLGSGGPLVLPDSAGSATHPHLLIGSGKGGVLYLIDRDNMGEFHSTTDSIVQEVAGGLSAAGSYGTAAFFNDGTTNRIYYGGKSDNLKAFTISGASLNTTPARSPDTFGLQGDTPSISANGSASGVVWSIDGGTSQLRAYNATPSGSPTALQELYTSGQNSARDAMGTAVQFTAPTVADGEVFVGTSSALVGYGEIASPTNPPSTPGTLVATDVNNVQINLTWGASSNTPFGYYVERSADGGNSWTQIATVGTTSYTVAGLQPGTTYSFRVRAYNSLGNSGYTNPASATTSNPSAVPNFPSGFSSGNGLLTINGTTAYTGTVLELTNGGASQAGSAFTSNAVSVQGFNTTFTFQLSSATADGFTFCIQGVGPTALGGGGGSLGYAGINNSVAVKFDLYPSLSTSGLYTGGAAPDDTSPPAIDMSGAGINLHSGDIMQATFTYDGVNLVETVTDTSTNASFNHTYQINIPATVGAGFAFVGFTGATGGATAIQDIRTWTYTPVLAAPYTPATLTVTPASGTELDLGWTEPYSSVTNFNILKFIGGSYQQFAQVSGSTFNYHDTTLSPGATASYEVVASNAAGDSAPAGPVSNSTPTPPLPVSNLQTSALGTTGVTLNWQNNATNANNIVIMRQLESDSSQFVVSLPATATSFVDTNLLPGRAYDYIVAAMNLAGPSTGVEVNIQTIPAVPTGLSAAAGGNEAYLTWTPEGHAVDSYNIYRSTTSGTEVKVASNVTGSAFTDTGRTAGQAYFYKITAVDSGGESTLSSEVSVTPVAPFVADRLVFYNDSSFNGNHALPTAEDDNAIAPNKSALLPGQTATAANVTGFVKGLNGVMIDISGLGNAAALSANDFTFRTSGDAATWTAAPVPAAVNVRPGAGPNGSDRITIDWGDNQIRNTWLQVSVKADGNTGLTLPDTFYFGNLIGDTGNDTGAAAMVSATDLAAVRSASLAPITVSTGADVNKDGLADATDSSIIRSNTTHSLPFFTAPAGAAAAAPAASDPPPAPAVPAVTAVVPTGTAATAATTTTATPTTTTVTTVLLPAPTGKVARPRPRRAAPFSTLRVPPPTLTFIGSPFARMASWLSSGHGDLFS